MIVLKYAKDGNLREYLKINFNNISWKQKLYNLYPNSMSISDFGLSKLVEKEYIWCIAPENYYGYWDARVTHRFTIGELTSELCKYKNDYDDYLKEGKNKDTEIVIQIKNAKEFSANQESINTTTTTTTTPLNYQTQFIQSTS
ncbi:hypothetical protein Glove_83g44 [Diversispora epigaea]|uniref:Protein kinase domain-containing protein n=1 Tax=Diversispora epigaea TaxID=1348612 RepID=A0A397JC51_9GLOM|nr:hypothetical protein Glove_83g44 [Diversispora epigaea]